MEAPTKLPRVVVKLTWTLSSSPPTGTCAVTTTSETPSAGIELADTLTDAAFSAFGQDLPLCRKTVGALQRILLTHARLLGEWAAKADPSPAGEQGDIDSGTGLPNHRALLRQLGALLQSWSGQLEVLALLVIDVKFSQMAADNEAYIDSETLYAESARPCRYLFRIGLPFARLAVPAREQRDGARGIVPPVRRRKCMRLPEERVVTGFRPVLAQSDTQSHHPKVWVFLR